MRPPKEQHTVGEWLQKPEMTQILSVFENLEIEEMQNFYDAFENSNCELAHELMSDLEWEVIKKVNDLLDWRRQKEICFFSEQNEIIIKDTIKTSIWRVIVNELVDNELGKEFERIK